ncbi:MAG: response regulator receiver protein [Caulobacteraceae bacterium]|nr:response regulator receiver protein [Caulobacteraceae bacterium]
MSAARRKLRWKNNAIASQLAGGELVFDRMNRRSQETVLVVEDEPLLRELSAGELKEAGYDVLEAPTAAEALVILTSGVAIAVVFTDVNMPGNLNGLELSEMVRERWPEVRLIVTSGGGEVGHADIRPPGRFIPKPYRLDQMIAAVCDLAGDTA